MAAQGGTRRLDYRRGHGRSRRVLVIAARPGEGPLSERTPALQPGRRERVKVPHCGNCLEFRLGTIRDARAGGGPLLSTSRDERWATWSWFPYPSSLLTSATKRQRSPSDGPQTTRTTPVTRLIRPHRAASSRPALGVRSSPKSVPGKITGAAQGREASKPMAPIAYGARHMGDAC